MYETIFPVKFGSSQKKKHGDQKSVTGGGTMEINKLLNKQENQPI